MRVIRIKICQIPSFYVVTSISFCFYSTVYSFRSLFFASLVSYTYVFIRKFQKKEKMRCQIERIRSTHSFVFALPPRLVWFLMGACVFMDKIVFCLATEISTNESIQSHYYLCVHGRLILLFAWNSNIIIQKPFYTRNKSQNKYTNTHTPKYFKRIN